MSSHFAEFLEVMDGDVSVELKRKVWKKKKTSPLMALLNAVKYIRVQMENIESMWQIVKCRIKQCWQVMNQARKGEKCTLGLTVHALSTQTAEDADAPPPKIVLHCNLLRVSRCHMISTFANKANYFLWKSYIIFVKNCIQPYILLNFCSVPHCS